MANSTICQSKWKPIVEPWPKTYCQAPTHWLKFYEEAVIESEARTAVVQLKSKTKSHLSGSTWGHRGPKGSGRLDDDIKDSKDIIHIDYIPHGKIIIGKCYASLRRVRQSVKDNCTYTCSISVFRYRVLYLLCCPRQDVPIPVYKTPSHKRRALHVKHPVSTN